jgi:hypothetical protein
MSKMRNLHVRHGSPQLFPLRHLQIKGAAKTISAARTFTTRRQLQDNSASRGLYALDARRRLTGKPSIEVTTVVRPDIARVTASPVDFIVFLKRRRGPSELTPYLEEPAQKWFEQVICYATHEVRAAQRASLRSLSGANVSELQCCDFDGAIVRLESMGRGSDRRQVMSAEAGLHV